MSGRRSKFVNRNSGFHILLQGWDIVSSCYIRSWSKILVAAEIKSVNNNTRDVREGRLGNDVDNVFLGRQRRISGVSEPIAIDLLPRLLV
jgi:hypothetical protein